MGWTEQDSERARAALVRAGRTAVVSHELAALAHGLDLVDDPVARLTVPRNASRRVVPGWQVRRAPLPAADVVEVAGLRLTTPARTVADLCRVLPPDRAVATADSALRTGAVSLEELALGRALGRGAARLRLVGSLVDPRSASVLESLLRVLLALAGLPAPEPQYVVRDRAGGFVGRVDLCWPAARLVVEADGFAFHSDRASYRSDRRRLNELERLGWRVLRFSWEDVLERPQVVVAVVRDCLALAA